MASPLYASGFIFVNKPNGYSSAQVLNGIKAQYHKGFVFDENASGQVFAEPKKKLKNKERLKIGHTGTLDSFAGGLLICPYGQATVFAETILRMRKTYLAEFFFGKTTDSLDPVGQTTAIDPGAWRKLWPNGRPSRSVLSADFVSQQKDLNPEFEWPPIPDGKQAQMPPDFSAKKIGGKRASDLKRQGKEVVLKPKDVEIHTKLFGFVSARRLRLGFQVSSGTYIRAIARDWGQKLGIPCYVNRLFRPDISYDPLLPASWSEQVELVDPRVNLGPGDFWVWPGFDYMRTVLPCLQRTESDPAFEQALNYGKKVEIGETKSCFAFHGGLPANNLPLIDHDAPESCLLWTEQGKLALWMDDIQWQENQIINYRIKKNFLAV